MVHIWPESCLGEGDSILYKWWVSDPEAEGMGPIGDTEENLSN